jgi:hypothetical protein
MRRGKWFLLGSGLAGCLALIGCMTMGRPLDTVRAHSASEAATKTPPEVPLVPVPPPPLGAAEPASPITPVSAPPSDGVPSPGTSASPPAPAPAVTARQLHKAALESYAAIDGYIVRLRRREQVKTDLNPEELIKLTFRKSPWSVHLKWLGKQGQGREVVFVPGQYGGKIHTRLAAGDVPLVPAGKRMSFLPDNLLVRSASRHPITEAGIGAGVDRIGATLDGIERGAANMGTVVVLTGMKRPEFKAPVCGLEHRLPPGLDPSLPKGGKRTWFFDPETKLPMLIVTYEADRLVEYYHYDRLESPVKLLDADFDPDQLWGKPAGR